MSSLSTPTPPPPLPPQTDATTAEMEAEAETEATLTSNESLQTDMPMTMAASVVLDHLPRDAHDALSKAGMLEQEKSSNHLHSFPLTFLTFHPHSPFYTQPLLIPILLYHMELILLNHSNVTLPPGPQHASPPRRSTLQNVFISTFRCGGEILEEEVGVAES